MENTVILIAGLTAWAVLTVILLGVARVGTVIGTGKAANSFTPDGSDVPGLTQRLTRVHANVYENLAMLIALPLLALITGKTGITEPLALYLLCARIVQSVIHMISTSVVMVNLRFLAFLVQVVIVAYWAILFLGDYL